MKFLFYSSLLLTILLSSCWSKKNWAASDSENEFHVLDIAAHLSTSVCQTTPPPGLKKRQSSAVAEVIHRHGACAAELLSKNQTKSSQPRLGDQSRVNSFIQKRQRGRGRDLPVYSGHFLHDGNYIVTMSLGTPERKLFLILDTGSDLTWFQCQPCSLTCHTQQGPIFDPYKSTSYSDSSWNSSECSALAASCIPGRSITNKCTYTITYGDDSVSTGYLGKDKLTIAPNEAFPDFACGCSLFTQGNFGLENGLVGLGKGPISLVSQTAKKYGGCFSYCLPSTSAKGFLLLGKDYDHTTKFTPLIDHPSSYIVNITAIAVEGRNLPANNIYMPPIPILVDSGTVISRLPSDVYKALSSKFRQAMRTKYGYKGDFFGDGFFDTCFVPNSNKTPVPSVSFTFQNNVKVDLDASGTVYVFNESFVCLAFTDDNFAIFGNTQQKTFEVVYDVAGHRLGFRRGMCT
ncbi:eukaryotic aspartyl protease family protein [Striga asiatica]|uniref:Eukaryotic aspartyl protease family protein n=1 Tax=Striga asiatica TaxID=4170 RepID=A0A5A7QTI5_STRAF|nr:eukaryotic aspartyl protease family protein [Striga asiatica]